MQGMHGCGGWRVPGRGGVARRAVRRVAGRGGVRLAGLSGDAGAVLKLEVTPQITPEGNIILDLDVNKDSRGETTTQGVAIDTKHVKTQILIENGGTVVIGGIFEMEETNQENKIPVLGDVPVVGNLFKNRTKESTKREMLIFISPKVINERTASR